MTACNLSSYSSEVNYQLLTGIPKSESLTKNLLSKSELLESSTESQISELETFGYFHNEEKLRQTGKK